MHLAFDSRLVRQGRTLLIKGKRPEIPSGSVTLGEPPSRGERPSREAWPTPRALDRNTSSRTAFRLYPSVRTNSRVRRYLPLSGSRTIAPVP